MTMAGFIRDAARQHFAPVAHLWSGHSSAGDRMEDGTIYAGISPDTGEAMYTTPADAPLTMRWNAAMQYAAKLEAHGHKDWRAPTKAELNVLFRKRAAIGGFDLSGDDAAGCYWSSTASSLYNEAAMQ